MPPMPPSPFWGKWGALNPQWSKKFLEMTFNRGYGQPIITGQYTGLWDAPGWMSYFARRYDSDFLKIVAMRGDAARIPLVVLRRQIWLLRAEYWFRKMGARHHIKRAAMIEWAFIKTRLGQPFTWTGRDLVHAMFWLINIAFGFCAGEIFGRQMLFGYIEVADPAWSPARPQFAPGFWHIHAGFDNNYPFDKHETSISRQFSRGYWPNSDHIYYCPNRLPANLPLMTPSGS
jgi:hypothetical protein